MRRLGLAPLAFYLAAAAAWAANPSGQAVMAAVLRRTAAVNDYRVDLKLTVKGENISINGMAMTLYYKKPDKMRIEARQGVGIIPSGTYIGDPIAGILRQRKPVYLKSERLNGVECHVLRLEPAEPTAGQQPMTVWVDKRRNVVLATEASEPFHTRTTWRYSTVERRFYLPVEMKAEIDMEQQGKVRAVVTFSGYRINRGIPDSVFDQKPGNK